MITSDRSPRAPDIVDHIARFNDWVMHRVPGGAQRAHVRDVVNLHKLTVGPMVLLLMCVTHQFSLAAHLYLVLHGSYGVLWVAKDIAFGDASWRQRCSLGSCAAVLGFLSLYYVAPLTLLTPLGRAVPGAFGAPAQLSAMIASVAVACFVLGVFLHFTSDCQKYFVLKHQRPRALITSGLFAFSRNPNYLGEILIYSSFNLLAQHWLPWVACLVVWLQVFLVNMIQKERSMSRYPEHADWVRRTGFLLPSLTGLLGALPRAFGAGDDTEGSRS